MDRLEAGEHANDDHRVAAGESCGLDEWRLLGRPESMAVVIDGDADLSQDYEGLARLAHITLRFTTFMDGRAFSQARRLRERGFTGELVADGEVLPDQWEFLQRCGFTSLADEAIRERADALTTFTDAYQSDERQPQPLFRRRFGDAHRAA